jgi:hypothetical protein
VTLHFQAGAHAGFLELAGRAEVLTDRARIKELWNFMRQGRRRGGHRQDARRFHRGPAPVLAGSGFDASGIFSMVNFSK